MNLYCCELLLIYMCVCVYIDKPLVDIAWQDMAVEIMGNV